MGVEEEEEEEPEDSRSRSDRGRRRLGKKFIQADAGKRDATHIVALLVIICSNYTHEGANSPRHPSQEPRTHRNNNERRYDRIIIII